MAGPIGFQSYMGPGDRDLPMSEVRGYQPVSRIGEVVMNAFVDAHEYEELNNTVLPDEEKPMLHDWATVQPGMICVSRKAKNESFRNYVAAETAVPVLASAAKKTEADQNSFFFAGVARSKSVRTPNDGIGPSVDEYFTVTLGGMVTLLNSSKANIKAGDLVVCTIHTSARSTHTQ